MLDRTTREIRVLLGETAGLEAWELLRSRVRAVPKDVWDERQALCTVFVGRAAADTFLKDHFASIGFVAKLFAEAIEEISLKQVEAVRATGASFMNVISFGVMPQVFGRFVGFATYQLDSNLRNSTMVGIVGAGGIGGTLFSAFQRFDYDFVAAILLSIIALIMAGEALATWVRGVFLERGKVEEE